MFCPRCGNNNDNNARFCFSCGQRFQQGNQPAGPSGPQWGQFQDPAPAPPPPPTPVAPPPPTPRVVPTQIVSTPPPAKRTNPALAVAIIAGLAIVMGAVFFVTRDDGKSGGGPFGGGGQSQVEAQPTKAPGSATPGASPVPSANDGPVIAPGYKMTAIFVPPQGSNATPDVRIYDAIVQGVDWNDSAKVYGRRYPLQYVFNNATTNLLLKPPNVDQAKRLLTAAGFSATAKPKILLTFNPSDRPFASWLSNQMQSLGYNVITDANSFTAEEKAKGYHGLIIAILPA